MTKDYANIRTCLENKGKIIDPNDLLIAATVLSKKGVLVTNNVKECERVEALEIVNWAE